MMKRANWSWVAPLAIAGALLPALVFGGQASYPHKFVNGEVADADQVNANFSALAIAIDDNDDRVSSLEAGAATRGMLVKLVSTQDESLNGQALIDAFAAVPADVSPLNPFKIQLEAGSYDVGSTSLELASGLVLCGVDQEVSVIRSSADVALRIEQVVLRDFQLAHEPANDDTTAISCVSLDGNELFQPIMRNVDVGVDTTTSSTGINLHGRVGATMHAVVVRVRGGFAGNLRAVHASKAAPYAASFLAVRCIFQTRRGLTDVTVNLEDAAATMHGCLLFASDTALRHASSIDCRAKDCRFSSDDTAIDGSLRTHIACSEIDGTIVGAVRTVHCYDADFNALP